MATVQTNGTSPVTYTSTDNNGGTIKSNGLASGTFQSSAITLENVGVFGSTVVNNNDADKALNSGVFAYNNQSPVSKRTTSTLSTVSNNVLLSGAAQPALIRSIHKLETLRTRKLTTAIRENRWNEYTGEFDSGYPQVVVDSLANDVSASPTRNNPGVLNYKSSGPTIVSDNYSKKTG